ncbi:hypothetical protein [Anaerovorax odorimutans]|nr:hypothetical protein [Anaerovorax odorimutans]
MEKFNEKSGIPIYCIKDCFLLKGILDKKFIIGVGRGRLMS